jgi:hypothetical protein
MMHVIDALLDSFSNLFRSHRYSPLEKLYCVILFTIGLSLRDLSERLCLTGASRESVRIWVHRFSSLFMPSRRVRRLIAIDGTVLKVNVMIVEVVQEMKDRTKRSCNNINAKKLKCLEELVTAIANMHNIII